MIPEVPTDESEQDARDAVFIEQYRLTGDAVTACVRAGIRDPSYPITVVAQKQLQRPEIAAALKALSRIETSLMPLEVTRDSIVSDMEDVYGRAMTDGQYSSAIGAKRLQSFLLGLMDQKITITHGFQPDKMTDEQLMRIVDGRARDISKDVIEVEDDG